jgi:hypothetical protein
MSPRLRYGLTTWLSLVMCWFILGPLQAFIYVNNSAFFPPWKEVKHWKARDPADQEVIYLTTVSDTHYGMTGQSFYLCSFDGQTDVTLTTCPDMVRASQGIQEMFRWRNPWTLIIMGVQICLLSLIITGLILTWRGWSVRARFYVLPVAGLLLMECFLPMVFRTGHPLYGRTGLSSLLTVFYDVRPWGNYVSGGFAELRPGFTTSGWWVAQLLFVLFAWVGTPLLAARAVKRPEQLNANKYAENEKRDGS